MFAIGLRPVSFFGILSNFLVKPYPLQQAWTLKPLKMHKKFFSNVSDILTLCIWLRAVRIWSKDVLAKLKWIYVDCGSRKHIDDYICDILDGYWGWRAYLSAKMGGGKST